MWVVLLSSVLVWNVLLLWCGFDSVVSLFEIVLNRWLLVDVM